MAQCEQMVEVEAARYKQTQYLTDLFTYYTSQRTLRSCQQELLQVPRTKLKTVGDRAFSVAGAVLWNNLPLNLKKADNVESFNILLKTYLFTLAYC